MQTYLLAATLFAITALLIGLYNFSKGKLGWRLIPLFLLVISRLLALIFFLQASAVDSSPTIVSLIATFEVLSVFAFVWSLTNVLNLSSLWRQLAWWVAGLAVFLAFIVAFPDWPIPYQFHSVLIAIFAGPFILMSLRQISWLHLISPIMLAFANFLGLRELETASAFVTMVAYALLVAALHWEGMQRYRGRQAVSETMAREALNVSQGRQRTLEVSEIISAVPGLDQSLAHVARTMAHVTHTDQSAIFAMDDESADQIRLATIYAPERSMDYADYQGKVVRLSSVELLQTAISQQRQLLHPQSDDFSSYELYSLWDEARNGPALIQPLYIQGQPIGALVLANPVTNRPIREDNQALCNSLSSQIAMMVEAYRQYDAVQQRSNSLQVTTKTQPAQTGEAVPEIMPSVIAEASLGEPTQTATIATVAPVQPPVVKQLPPSEESASLSETAIKDQKRYSTIIDALQEGVVVSNARGRVKLVNHSAEQILRKPKRELLDQPIGTIYGKIDSGDSIDSLAVAFSRRDEPLPTYYEDDERVIQGQLIPWRNSDREWLGIIAVFRDVTRQVQADRTRNDFITSLTRTLRRPLTLIKGYTELISEGTLGEYSSDQLQIQRIIHSSAEQVALILDNAVQVSAQYQNQILPKKFESINVVEVINQVMNNLTPYAELNEVELTAEVQADVSTIIADAQHLHRILENLISNACQFTPPGGYVTLKAWVQQEREGNREKPYLQIAVIDNGVGIPPTEQKRVFDPFYQLNNQTPENEVGMGMGLTVVKELVQLHNGRVWVESTSGVGSIFQVSLPMSQA